MKVQMVFIILYGINCLCEDFVIASGSVHDVRHAGNLVGLFLSTTKVLRDQ
jgi:hypothetical protein